MGKNKLWSLFLLDLCNTKLLQINCFHFSLWTIFPPLFHIFFLKYCTYCNHLKMSNVLCLTQEKVVSPITKTLNFELPTLLFLFFFCFFPKNNLLRIPIILIKYLLKNEGWWFDKQAVKLVVDAVFYDVLMTKEKGQLVRPANHKNRSVRLICLF